MTDGGLDEAVERTRAARAAAERKAAEGRQEAERQQREAERRQQEARERVRAAGRSFAQRAREAGIPFDEVTVHAGWREVGIFKKTRKPVYSSRRDRWVPEASYYDGGGVSDNGGGYTVRIPIEVLQDGTVLLDGAEYEPPGDGTYSRVDVDDVLNAMSNYLVDKTG